MALYKLLLLLSSTDPPATITSTTTIGITNNNNNNNNTITSITTTTLITAVRGNARPNRSNGQVNADESVLAQRAAAASSRRCRYVVHGPCPSHRAHANTTLAACCRQPINHSSRHAGTPRQWERYRLPVSSQLASAICRHHCCAIRLHTMFASK